MDGATIVLPQHRLLVVEDNYLMAEVVCDFVRDCGMEPVGPGGDLESGLELAWHEKLSGAILDINLRGRPVFPICSVLTQRRVPFVFLSGYTPGVMVPHEYRAVPHVEKPFIAEEFREELDVLVGGGRPRTAGSPSRRQLIAGLA